MTAFLRLLRQLRRAPAFAFPVVIGVAVAVGAATAVFSVFSAIQLRSLGVDNPQRLVALWRADEAHGQKSVELSYRDLTEWQKADDVLDGMALASSVNLDLSVYVGDRPEQVDSTTVSGNYFRVLGATPFAGRLLTEDDDRAGATAAVLSYRFWRTRLGGDFGIVGKSLRVSGGAVTVVGIARPEFDFPRDVAVWLPLHAAWPDVERSADLGVFRSVARLKPGVTAARARTRLEAIGARRPVLVTPLLDEMFGAARPATWILLGAVLLVLLIACANAANLLLNRAAERGRELAIRTALGASRKGLFRLLVAEAAILAAASGALGLILAAVGIRVIVALAPAGVPRIADAALDPWVLLFGLGLAMVTVLLFGFGPAFLASRRDPNEVLQQAGRGSTRSHAQSRLGRLLLALEGALTALLLVGAGTLVHSFANLAAVDPGFRPQRILTFRVTLENAEASRRAALYSDVLSKVRALPGVESAAAVLIRPLSGAVGWDTVYAVEGQPPSRSQDNPNGNYEAISPDYFRTMGIRLVAGRDFTSADTPTTPGVVIIDENTARRHWPHGDAVGKRIRLGSAVRAPWLTVVGVAAAVRYREWQSAWPDFYVPMQQRAQHRSDFVVKTTGDPWTLANAVRRAVFDIDKNQPISEVTTMDALVDRTLSGSRFNGVIVSTLASCALLLAAFGIYAALSYAVTQRRAEICVRMAVGASPADIVRLIGRDTAGWALLGAGTGFAAATWLRSLLARLLFGITGPDPAAYAFAIVTLLLACAAASVVPAYRVAATDPARALQSR